MAPALVGVDQNCMPSKPAFNLKDILDNGFVWCPTPKKRTTAEKK